MAIETTIEPKVEDAAPAAQEKALSLIDCDVHHIMKSFQDLVPYLTDRCRHRLAPAISPEAEERTSFQLPRRAYFHPYSSHRGDTTEEDGTSHAADPVRIKEDLLDRYGIDYVVLLGNDLTTLSGMPDPELAAGISRAYNDWSIDVWLRADPRFKLSIWVAPQDPALAAQEIERLGDHPDVVQVTVPQMDILLGKRHYWPIYEAAQKHGLPVAFHVGPESAGVNGPQVAVGAPTHYIEVQTGVVSIGINNVISLVCEGVFEKFPDLKTVFLEFGFTWIPGLMWRLDREWKSLRAEVPWVKRPPSEYILEHVRVGSQPLEEPPHPEYLHQTLEMMSAGETMLFATDYPHWDFDDPKHIIRRIPEHMRQGILVENARKLYGL